ncbi:hypothetical protein PCLA_04r0238 [Pseudomonas citronellolis]|nr:hypothetical protein PCLA_04r0238 [Pseudomonas citronellolis]
MAQRCTAATDNQPAQRWSRLWPRRPTASQPGRVGARRTTTGQPAASTSPAQAGASSGKCSVPMPQSRSWARKRSGAGQSRREPRCELSTMAMARS